MNKVVLIGNLTKDPDKTTTSNGVDVARFTIAVQRKFKNEDGNYESDFINCIAWRTKAEFISKYFKKGNKIAIEGAIQTRSYEASDGTKRYVTEIVVEDCEFVQKREESGKEVVAPKPEPIDDDDLPF